MSRSFNTLPNCNLERITLARSGRRTYKVRGEFSGIPKGRERRQSERPDVRTELIPAQDVVKIKEYRRRRDINPYVLNKREQLSINRMVPRGWYDTLDDLDSFIEDQRRMDNLSADLMDSYHSTTDNGYDMCIYADDDDYLTPFDFDGYEAFDDYDYVPLYVD